jgi:hypothetical protein
MPVNSVSTQTTDLSKYQNPIDAPKKVEDPHDKMLDMLATPTHVNSLREQTNILEMPEEVENLLKTPSGDLEKALMDYMKKHGINSMTFINLDDNGNVASIVTVMKQENNDDKLHFKQSERTPGGDVDQPYSGNFNNAHHIDDFINFTRPTPAAAYNNSDAEPDESVTTRRPLFLPAEKNDDELQPTLGTHVSTRGEPKEYSFKKMTPGPANKKRPAPEPTHNLKRQSVDDNDKENTPPPRKAQSHNYKNYINKTSFHFGNVTNNTIINSMNVNGDQKSEENPFANSEKTKSSQGNKEFEAGMTGFGSGMEGLNKGLNGLNKGLDGLKKGMDALKKSTENLSDGITVGGINQTVTKGKGGTTIIEQSIGPFKSEGSLSSDDMDELTDEMKEFSNDMNELINGFSTGMDELKNEFDIFGSKMSGASETPTDATNSHQETENVKYSDASTQTDETNLFGISISEASKQFSDLS